MLHPVEAQEVQQVVLVKRALQQRVALLLEPEAPAPRHVLRVQQERVLPVTAVALRKLEREVEEPT